MLLIVVLSAIAISNLAASSPPSLPNTSTSTEVTATQQTFPITSLQKWMHSFSHQTTGPPKKLLKTFMNYLKNHSIKNQIKCSSMALLGGMTESRCSPVAPQPDTHPSPWTKLVMKTSELACMDHKKIGCKTSNNRRNKSKFKHFKTIFLENTRLASKTNSPIKNIISDINVKSLHSHSDLRSTLCFAKKQRKCNKVVNSSNIFKRSAELNVKLSKSNRHATVSQEGERRRVHPNNSSEMPEERSRVMTSGKLQGGGGSGGRGRGRRGRQAGQKRRRQRRGRRRGRRNKDLSLWIARKQVKIFSGYLMEISVIHNGQVLPYVLDPNFESQLPVIPSQVENVNFTWCAGLKKYFYNFDYLYSENEDLLHVPVLSLPSEGRVPRKPKVFSIEIQCTGNQSGVATFGIGLSIQTSSGKPLAGTPLRLQLRKECTELASAGPVPECDHKCENGGVCTEGQHCQCPEGYMGQYCHTALCYPQCMNGGTCTSPGRCSCPPGFQGRHCEGGICQFKCQNGGKCIQKDTCECRRGFYGNQCEFSKCVIPCVNGGRCRDVNKCRCPKGFAGDHCEVMMAQDTPTNTTSQCRKRCRNGTCNNATCQCHQGYMGRWCRRRGGRNSSSRQKKRVWV